MNQGYFYTLSAITQAFAAIVSLYAIFVIYKLQILKGEQENKIVRLRRLMLKERRFQSGRNIHHGYDEEFVESLSDKEIVDWAQNKSGRGEIISAKEEEFRKIEELNKFKNEILDLLKKSLKINGITIGFSLVCLPWGNFIQAGLLILILIIAISLGISALYVTIRAIWLTIIGY